MRKARFYTGLLGLMAALTLFIGGCGPAEFVTYENTDYGLSIQYPENWNVSEDIGDAAVAFFAEGGRAVTGILVEDVSVNLQEYTEFRLALLEVQIMDFELLESSEAMFAGNIARKVVFTGDRGFKGMDIWTVKGGIAYAIRYTSHEDDYDVAIESIQRMINSFEVTSSRPPALFPTNSEPTQFLTYENVEHEISTLYPSNWVKFESDGSRIVEFFAPGGRTSFGIATFEVSGGLEAYIDSGMRYLASSVMGLNIQDSVDVVIDGNVAHKIVYTGEGGSKVMEIWTVRDGIGYDLVYASDEPDYEFFLDTAQKMIDSFEITASPSPALPPPVPTQFSTYENEDSGISTSYPSNWNILEDVGAAEVVFFAPGGQTDFRIFILDNVFETIDNNLENYTDFILQEIASSTEELSILDSSESLLAGNVGHKIVYTEAPGLKNMEIWTVKGGKAYILSYYSDEIEYELFLDIAQRIIDSFEITASPPPTVPTQFSIYESSRLGIKTLYPSDWMYYDDEDIGLTFFSSPGDQTVIGAGVEDVSLTFQGYTEQNLQGIVGRFTILESGEATLDENVAHRVVYIGADGLKSMEIWTVKGGKAYFLAYYPGEDEFEFFLDIAQRMIDSFEITSP